MSLPNSSIHNHDKHDLPAAETAAQDRFMANLRQTLEHIGDVDWLKANAALQALMRTAATPAKAAPIPPQLGVKALDEKLTAIWQEWETQPKTPLQQAVWTAVRHIPPNKDANYSALLLLTYFQDPRPKQGDLIKDLALGKSTFYRQLDAAVQALARELIAQLQPSLRLEKPPVKPLIGRDALLRDCLSELRAHGMVSLIGASGLGKTALGAAVAAQWQQPVFWHTLRPGLTDNVQNVLFGLAFFLHQHGASQLWLHLNTDPHNVSTGHALGSIRTALQSLRATPPLLCFDEADLLLPNELDDEADHAQLRAFIEDLAQSAQGCAAMLFMGQRLLMASAPGRVLTLERFGLSEIHDLLQSADVAFDALDSQAHEALLKHTRGNPLLLQLFISLHTRNADIAQTLASLSSPVSLDWFLARLRRHLSSKELDAFDALAVFDAPAPISLWRSQKKALENLIKLNLAEPHPDERVRLPIALREAAYRQLPSDVRAGLHLSAARVCELSGEFTHAARHFVLGNQPELAIWVWHNHQDDEVRQGQATTALNLFEPLRWRRLRDPRDQRALVLILARLYALSGKHADGLDALDSAQWPRGQASSSRAHELRARLLALQGDVDAALAQYRLSLDDLQQASAAQHTLLHVGLAQHLHAHANDRPAARKEALHASLQAEQVRGEIELHSGQLDLAQQHFANALALAQQVDDARALAKLNESLGILHTQQRDLPAALQYFDEAETHYRAFGNLVCAVAVTENNRAFAYMMLGQHAAAVPHLQRLLHFAEEMRLPYFQAGGLANLAEALFHCGEIEQAEQHCLHSLRLEDATWRPQCLYVLGHIRRTQGQWAEAERLCREAIAEAEQSGDVWVLGPAREALALVLAAQHMT